MRHYWLTCDAPDLPADAFRKAFGRNRPETLEGGKGSSAPAAPDPFQTAAATTQTNEATAAYNKALNLNNYSNPFGSQNTVQTGFDPSTGAPIYGTTISANPQLTGALNGLLGQASNSSSINQNAINGLYDLNQNYNQLGSNYWGLASQMGGLNSGLTGLGSQYAGIGNQYAGLGTQYAGLNNQYGSLGNQYAALGNQLNQGQAAAAQQQGQNAAYNSSMAYLSPQFSQQQESTDAQLANQGLAPGSQAWNNAEGNLSRNQTFQQQQALNNAVLTGSQIGSQNLQNQIAGINTQSGLLGSQAGVLGSQAGLVGAQGNVLGAQSGLLGAQAGLYGQQAQNLAAQGGLYGQVGNTYGAQSGLMGQLSGIGAQPYSQIGSIASLIPGYSGTSQSAASPANIAQYQQNAYQGQLAGYNAQQSSSNATTGALTSLAGAAAMAFF